MMTPRSISQSKAGLILGLGFTVEDHIHDILILSLVGMSPHPIVELTSEASWALVCLL
jgi:hypothetical protein